MVGAERWGTRRSPWLETGTVTVTHHAQPVSGRQGAVVNVGLAAALKESGCSYASLALRVNELGRRQGRESNYDKASVTRWLQGGQPRGTTPELIAAVLSHRLGRPVAPAELGFISDRQRPVVARALAYREDVAETLHTLAELGSTDISRRSLLGAVPFVAGALVTPQREWLLWMVENQDTARLAPAAEGGRVEQVHAAINMFDEMDNRFGGGQVRASIVLYLSTEVVPMLQQRGAPPRSGASCSPPPPSWPPWPAGAAMTTPNTAWPSAI